MPAAHGDHPSHAGGRVQTPYTPNPFHTFLLAQASVGATGCALAWLHRRALGWGLPLFVVSLALTGGATAIAGPVLGLHGHDVDRVTLGILRVSAGLALVSVLLARPNRATLALAIAATTGLEVGDGFFADSTRELCSLHLVVTLLLLGLLARGHVRPTEERSAPRPREHVEDALLFFLGVVLAWSVGRYVLHGGFDSSDESAYVFQAHVFAKFRSYADATPCGTSLHGFWVFDWHGRRFSQYTPGWPLFLVPFVWTRSLPLAGPVALGLFAVGAARVARRLAPAASRRWAGRITGASILLSATCLINGGSYYSHVWVTACFLWAIESLHRVGEARSRRGELVWGILFGTSFAWMIATRPTDGALLGVAVAGLALWRARSRRLSARALAAASLSALTLGGWTLWVLHRQLGEWFTTGYSLTSTIHPEYMIAWSLPAPDEWKWGVPLGTGSYCWFPASPALALFGFVLHRRRDSVALGLALGAATLALFGFYAMLDVGRGADWGYGPRYLFPTLAAWSVGTGAAIAHRAATARGVVVAGAWAATTAVAVIGLAPLLYPANTLSVAKLQEVDDAANAAGVTHAVVLVADGVGSRGPLDYTKNLPIDLYPEQAIVVAHPDDDGDDQRACLRSAFPDRSFWRATGNPVRIDPAD